MVARNVELFDEFGHPIQAILFNTAKDGSGTWYFPVVDDDGNLVVTAHDITGISDGRKVVTTAGTREALAASTTAKYAVITAETDNTGTVVVGGATVVATSATRQGTPLEAGQSITVPCDNLSDIYLDSTVNGEGVTYIYFT